MSSSALTDLYARWIADLIPEPVLAEPRATCADCAMLPREGASCAPNEPTFEATTKCCTFLPNLPNFLAGAVLADPDPDAAAGRATVVARMRARAAVTPIGLGRPSSYGHAYRGDPGSFGRNLSLKCPHYLADGRCGIWKHREGTCATWFCKHERGGVSKRFWRALQRLLAVMEEEIAYWCVRELGADNEAMRRIYDSGSQEIDDTEAWLEREYEEVWGTWVGREEELYRAAAKLVAPLSFLEAARIAGPTIADFIIELGEASAALESEDLPARICAGDIEVIRIGETSARVKGYSEYDLREVPRALIDALPKLDGLTIAEARRTMATRHALRLTIEEVRSLCDFEILVPPPHAPEGEGA